MRANLFNVIILLVAHSVIAQQGDICEDVQDWRFICKDCQTMVTCIFLSDKWKSVELGKCDPNANLFCNQQSRNCSQIKNCQKFGRVDFSCNTQGIFPDPYNCRAFHVCSVDPITSNLVKSTMQCGNLNAFSPVTNECTANVSTDLCTRRQYSCLNVGDMGAWPGNLNIFYICVLSTTPLGAVDQILYPALFRCPLEQRFIGNRCTTSGGGLTPNTTQIPQINCTCSREGLFAHPTNCKMYCYCNIRLERMQYECPRNSYFNDSQKACVPGTC